MAGEKGFLPIDRQIYMSSKGAVEKPIDKDFRDKRSAAARDMERARKEDKHNMFRRMLKDAIRKGYRAKCVVGDAWFGCKENIETALVCGLTAIFQMKRGKLQYRLHKADERTYTAKELYQKCQRRLKKENKHSLYKTHRTKAWINLETSPTKAGRWHEIILVFSAPADNSGKETWVKWKMASSLPSLLRSSTCSLWWASAAASGPNATVEMSIVVGPDRLRRG